MPFTNKDLRQLETEKRRGWIIYILYVWRPKSLEMSSLLSLLDARNFPLTNRRVAEELDFLRSVGLLRVFERGGQTRVTDGEQEKLMQRFCDSEGEMNDAVCVHLTERGVNFQEGQFNEVGVKRVN